MSEVASEIMSPDFYCFYDDIKIPDIELKNFVGEYRFSQIVYKEKALKQHVTDFFAEKFSVGNIYEVNDLNFFNGVNLSLFNGHKVVYFFSNVVVKDERAFEDRLKNLLASNQNYALCDQNGKILVLVFENLSEYSRYLAGFNNVDIPVNTDFLVDISDVDNYLSLASTSFDSRFFNTLSKNDQLVLKKSSDKLKIRNEHNYYKYLPDFMKKWFVEPLDFLESENEASYSIQHYQMLNVSSFWIHNAFSVQEFSAFLDIAFYFIKERARKEVSETSLESVQNALYKQKVQKRILNLKSLNQYSQIQDCLNLASNFQSVDEVVDFYRALYDRFHSEFSRENNLVIGHGDFCFSNMLYDKNTHKLLLIDPLGYDCEHDIWTDEYYDIAKFSHSVMGDYDFLNSNKYSLSLTSQFNIKLEIQEKRDILKSIFIKYLQSNGYSYNLVRLYEASLFLSMLPLHIDNPKKVFAFLLNAINILQDLSQSYTNDNELSLGITR